MATPTELLAAVDAAILAMVAGHIQSYTVPGTSVTYFTLAELRDFRDTLVREVRSTTTSIRLGDLS